MSLFKGSITAEPPRIKAGETSGKLDEVLNYLADQQEKDYDLNSKIEEVKDIKTNKVFRIDNGEKYFFVCLDEKIKEQTIKDLKLNKEIMFVCLDDSLDDNQKINLSLKINLRSI